MSSSLVALRSYNENSALNAQVVSICDVDFYFSYQTIVAVAYGYRKYVCKNQWSVTTGKHLNWIDGGSKEAKKNRLEPEEFAKHIEAAIRAASHQFAPARVKRGIPENSPLKA